MKLPNFIRNLPEEVFGEVIGRDLYRRIRGGIAGLRAKLARVEAPQLARKDYQEKEGLHAALAARLPHDQRIRYTIGFLDRRPPLVGALGQNQREDVIVGVVDAGNPRRTADGRLVLDNEAEALRIMMDIADLGTFELKCRYAVGLELMKADEGEYDAVRRERRRRELLNAVTQTFDRWTTQFHAWGQQQRQNNYNYGINNTPPFGAVGRFFFFWRS